MVFKCPAKFALQFKICLLTDRCFPSNIIVHVSQNGNAQDDMCFFSLQTKYVYTVVCSVILYAPSPFEVF